MTVTTVRQKILSYLRKKQSASAQEIAQVLQVTAADARHHLNLLAADGRVTPSKEHSAGRGRPARRYQLSNALRGENLSALLDAALEEWLGKLSPSKREQALRSLAKRIANRSTLPIGPLAKRLAATVEKLNASHYQARWEAGAQGPRIVFANCPYAAIIAEHPELCRMDSALLEEWMALDARQLARIERGQGVCIFLLK